jgi:hypothetical protein
MWDSCPFYDGERQDFDFMGTSTQNFRSEILGWECAFVRIHFPHAKNVVFAVRLPPRDRYEFSPN